MNQSELFDKLTSALPIHLYGEGVAKSFQHLWREIEDGETSIIWENSHPIRVVQFAFVEIFSHDGKTLVEDRQEFGDGRIRRRGFRGISEKLKGSEDSLDGAKRGILEELGLNPELLSLEFVGMNTQENESSSYPGLMTRYTKFHYKTEIPAEMYQEEYIENGSDGMKTFFGWH